MTPTEMKARVKRFALDVIGLWRRLPSTRDYQVVGDQLLRSGTSVSSNYRAACRGRSHSEFTAKLGVVCEEADESQHWLDLLKEMGSKDARLDSLLHESSELVAMFTSAHKTATRRKRQPIGNGEL